MHKLLMILFVSFITVGGAFAQEQVNNINDNDKVFEITLTKADKDKVGELKALRYCDFVAFDKKDNVLVLSATQDMSTIAEGKIKAILENSSFTITKGSAFNQAGKGDE